MKLCGDLVDDLAGLLRTAGVHGSWRPDVRPPSCARRWPCYWPTSPIHGRRSSCSTTSTWPTPPHGRPWAVWPGPWPRCPPGAGLRPAGPAGRTVGRQARAARAGAGGPADPTGRGPDRTAIPTPRPSTVRPRPATGGTLRSRPPGPTAPTASHARQTPHPGPRGRLAGPVRSRLPAFGRPRRAGWASSRRWTPSQGPSRSLGS
jgi:hypothetical protein